MGKPEETVESYLKKIAEANGWLCLKFKAPGVSGVPDRMLIKNGEIYFIECKSPVGKLTKIQIARIREMESYGAKIRILASKPAIDAFFDQVN